ncbi:MAG: hypothetical protein WD766_00395 [Gemmatimonadota bacterium]
MKYRRSLLTAAFLVFAGCVETQSPTAPLLEQSVFTALGGLQVGESLTLSGSAAADVLLGGTSAAGDFVVVPFHASRVQGIDLLLEVAGQSLSTSSWAAPLTSAAGSSLTVPQAPSSVMHEELHRRLTNAVAPLLAEYRRRSAVAPSRSLIPATDLSGSNAQVGQLVELNTDVMGTPCGGIDLRTGRVEAITQRAIVVADIENPSGGFSRADYEAFGREFDDLVHPTITAVFSNPTDIDENGRVVIFFTRAVNEMTRPQDQGYVGGFFYARDLFFTTGEGSCPASNVGEMFYVLVPDPNREASHIPHTRDNVFRGAIGTIGHEYQHLINASRRIYVNDALAFEETWLDEGLSHIGEELLFYADAGIPPRSNVSAADLTEQHIVNAINRFGVQNLVRYGLYLEDVTRDSPTDSGDDLATRGAAWSFLRYAADHQEEQTDAEFFGGLVNSTRSGFDNLGAELEGTPLDWLQRWGVSVYTDDLVPASGDALLQQPSWNFRTLLPLLFDAFPLEVRTLTSSGSVQLNLISGTSGYVRFRSSPDEAARVSTTSGGTTPPEKLRVTVVRTG